MANHLNFANETTFFAQFSTIPDLKFYLQTVKLPSVTTGITLVRKNGVDYRLPGDSKDNGTVPLSFIVDEDYETYLILLEKQEEYRSGNYTDEILEVYIQNTQHINVMKLVFEDIFFEDVDGPALSTIGNETNIVVDATLVYRSFRWERLN